MMFMVSASREFGQGIAWLVCFCDVRELCQTQVAGNTGINLELLHLHSGCLTGVPARLSPAEPHWNTYKCPFHASSAFVQHSISGQLGFSCGSSGLQVGYCMSFSIWLLPWSAEAVTSPARLKSRGTDPRPLQEEYPCICSPVL